MQPTNGNNKRYQGGSSSELIVDLPFDFTVLLPDCHQRVGAIRPHAPDM